jgi:hypothetical protein
LLPDRVTVDQERWREAVEALLVQTLREPVIPISEQLERAPARA